MLKTVQLQVKDTVALTDSFVRRDACRRAQRCSRRFNFMSKTSVAHGLLRAPRRPWRARRGHRLAHGLLRAPRRHSASAAMLCAPRRHSASAAMLKTVPLHVEGPVAPLVGCRRRDAFRRARRCSRRFKSVSWTPWRSRAPSCAATPFGERGDAQDGPTPCRGPRGASCGLPAPRRF